MTHSFIDIRDVKVVLIDNHDSFTYNLVDELRVLGVELKVFRNNVATATILECLASYQLSSPTLLMLSPGPGAPIDGGNMLDVIHAAKGKYPVFKQLPQPLSIARYHSLIARDVPDCLQVIANIKDLPMAIIHEADKMLGFQFHPESILSCDGSELLQQAIQFLVSSDKSANSIKHAVDAKEAT